MEVCVSGARHPGKEIEMIERFRRIKSEFGGLQFGRTVLLLVGVVAMAAMGIFAFGSPWAAVVAVLGLIAGWLLRSQIVDHFEILSWAMPAALFIYGIVLFVGERVLGLSGELQVLIISITTVMVFDIQFWSLSDPSIVNIENQ